MITEVNGPVNVGDELVMRVEVRVDRDMEYVHLKDYRGSGTEPVNVLSQYKFQDGLYYYESTKDTASHFFIDYLPRGTYVFEYSVRVQHRGQVPNRDRRIAVHVRSGIQQPQRQRGDRRRVTDEAEPVRPASKKIVFLIGYRGSGKSTVGPLLAKRLGCSWRDSDSEIEKRGGRTIAEVFSSGGEESFREIEKATVAAMIEEVGDRAEVISLGGGAVLDVQTRTLIRQAGQTIWLDADADVLIARLNSDPGSHRPALSELGFEAEVRSILDKRCPIYAECADFRIDTGSLQPEMVTDKIVRWLSSADK